MTRYQVQAPWLPVRHSIYYQSDTLSTAATNRVHSTSADSCPSSGA